VAQALLVHVEPFVAHANELLADPANAQSRQATIKDLQVRIFLWRRRELIFVVPRKDMISAAERVGVPRKKRAPIQEFVGELMNCATNMMDIDASTPEGQKEAKKMQTTLNDISRAVKVTDMGPHTAMMNQIVELHKG
jgi:hypothetical protein